MLELAMCAVAACAAAVFVLLVRCRTGFERVLFLGLLCAAVIALIVLYAAHTGRSMYLDVALAFAVLGFMDVQFYAVYLRRKGDL